MQWPRFMRRPLNLISVPTVVEALPISQPGFAFGDPRQEVASLDINYGKGLLPFNAQSKSFVAPFPSQGENTQLLLERLDELPSKMMVALYESKTPLWPNFLIHHSDGRGLSLQAVRSCTHHASENPCPL